MRRLWLWAGLMLVGCGGGASDSEESATVVDETTQPTTGASGATGADDSTTAAGPGTSSAAATSQTDSAASETESGATDTEDGGSSTGEEQPVDCNTIPAGPFVANPVFAAPVFAGSEDIAFNGLGQLAGRQGDDIVLVDAAGAEVARYSDPGGSWGLRYLAGGDLLVAHHSSGLIRRITPEGVRSDFSLGLALVNGLYPDLAGNVWVTNFSTVGRYDGGGVYTELITGRDAASANGIVFDEERSLLFFTNYEQGRIRRVEVAGDGTLGAVADLTAVEGAFFDGLVLDECGHLYAVDNANGVVYRALLDAAGNAPGSATNITMGMMMNVANAQFGRGPGFAARSLYVAGEGGTVYELDVGVPGATIPLPG